jgi:hypothetical protein
MRPEFPDLTVILVTDVSDNRPRSPITLSGHPRPKLSL